MSASFFGSGSRLKNGEVQLFPWYKGKWATLLIDFVHQHPQFSLTRPLHFLRRETEVNTLVYERFEVRIDSPHAPCLGIDRSSAGIEHSLALLGFQNALAD